jgi:hypothetical protein
MHALILSAFLSAGADAEPLTPPKGPPPQLSFLEAKDGKVTRRVTELVPIAKEEEYTVLVGGVPEKRKRVVTMTMAVQRVVELSLAKATITTAGGKKLKEADALKRLAGGAIAVLSGDGRPVDAAYLRALKPDTLVIVMPATVPMPLPEKKLPEKPRGR